MKLILACTLLLSAITGFSSTCPRLFNGRFIYVDSGASVVLEDGTIKGDKWDTFQLFDGERPSGGDILSESGGRGMLKNKAISMKQIRCEAVEVTYYTLPNPYRSPLSVKDLYKEKFLLKITALELSNMGFEAEPNNFGREVLVWSRNELTIESGKMGNFMSWRKYNIRIVKKANGDLQFENTVKGFSLMPFPVPATWKNNFILKKIN